MRTEWEVRFEGPCDWATLFRGTYEECLAYARAIDDLDELSVEEAYIITDDETTIYVDDIV